MSRRPRLKLDGIPIHIRKPGNNRNVCFYADEDYQFYLESLDGYCHDEKVKVLALVLMINHVHLLVTPTDGNGPSRVMKRLGQRYVQYINRTYRLPYSLWEGRFRSSLDHKKHIWKKGKGHFHFDSQTCFKNKCGLSPIFILPIGGGQQRCPSYLSD